MQAALGAAAGIANLCPRAVSQSIFLQNGRRNITMSDKQELNMEDMGQVAGGWEFHSE